MPYRIHLTHIALAMNLGDKPEMMFDLFREGAINISRGALYFFRGDSLS